MIIIGEKINGAIPSVRQAIAQRNETLIVERTLAQAAAGADFLDCAPSTATEVEYEAMVWLIGLMQGCTDVPLCIDSPDAVRYSVIGGGKALGICGSGLVDAIAVGLEMGLINKRGRICNGEHIFRLPGEIYLTLADICQVQLAKGAVCTGILLMAKRMGMELRDIRKVQLAGAFGSFLSPENACRMGLLPEELADRIQVVGNAAGSGAKMLACDRSLLPLTQKLREKIEFLELASLAEFPRTFAGAMNFREGSR